MATKFGGQLDLNSTIRQVNAAQTDDVWVSQNYVIGEWGFDKQDLWDRVVDRHNELLSTGGIPCSLWYRTNNLPCTSEKDETGQHDARCPVCYGTGWVGGYEKFGFSTIHVAANSNIELENIEIRKTSPWQLEIARGETTGRIYSPIYHVRDSIRFIGAQLVGFNGMRDARQTLFTIEYSVDGGKTYLPISNSELLDNETFTLRFRVTLSRTNMDQNPYLRVFRARFQMSEYTRILISKRSFPEQTLLESFGLREKSDGLTWWTTPTLGVPIGGRRVNEEDIFEIETGLFSERKDETYTTLVSGRYKPVNVMYVEPRGRFLSQRFNIRMLQKDEPELSVF